MFYIFNIYFSTLSEVKWLLLVFWYAFYSLLLDFQFNLMQLSQLKIDVIDVFDDITIMLTSKITLDIITANNMNWIQI